MAVSLYAFYTELYEEHLEEASFLYEQRHAFFHDPDISWIEIQDVENRFEAHIDALVIGGDAALEVCVARVVEGDPGELHAAIRTFCRQRRIDLLEQVLDELDIEDEDRVAAACDALKHEWPGAWTADIERLIREHPHGAKALLPTVIGYRRLPLDQLLVSLLSDCPEAHLHAPIWSLGRLRTPHPPSISALTPFQEHPDPILVAAAALAMMRMSQPLSAECAVQPSEACDFRTLLQIMLAGGARDTAFLLERLDDSDGASDIALALGVLGDLRAILPLIQRLEDDSVAGSVALALNLITGAGLYEEVFVPDEVDPDELLDHEIEKLDRGESLYPPGQVPGTTIERLSQDAATWQQWWQDNLGRFRTGIRYRNGRPFTPDCLLDNLRDERSPYFVRQTAYEELVVRYKIDVHFETDMPVPGQLTAVYRMAEIISQGNSQWQAGQWYYAGKKVS